ncbi:MAG TPA: hypothetical protein VG498_18525 [Terriglobales bacterium]|nr:hypothetical protein [Terriglobales bacterium]
MVSTKGRSISLFVGLMMVFSSGLAAEEENTSYPGHIGMYNPCNDAVVIVDGTNHVHVHQNSHDRDDVSVSIQLRFVGKGEDQVGRRYHTILVAKGHFQTPASSYDIPYNSMWFGQRGAPSFSMDGTLRVWVESGAAAADGIVTYNTTCRKDVTSDDDHDKDWREDRDRGSRDDHDND